MSIEDQTEPTLIHSRLDYNLKMTRPEGSLVPTPPHTTAFRIGRVDRREFFTWAQDRVVRFANRATPASIQIESKSLLLDPQKLREYQFRYSSYAASPEYLELPATLDPRVRELARTIVGNLPHGWQQIEAISQHLQENYALTGNLAPESVKSDPLVDFLFSHRAGPDYQFASAATVMLRTLGYPTRLVAGWYAAPENFDPETSHTPVVAEDVHFWAEVRLPTGDWLIVEPSPGYERLTPSPSWMEQLTTSFSALFRWVARHWFPILISFLALLVMVWQRQRCWDLVARTCWAWFPGSNWQQQILRVGKILDQRARWYGFAKKPSQTYAQWLHQYQQGATDVSVLQTFSQWSDWASYGPGTAPNSNLNSQELGRAVLNHFPLNYFRQLKRQQTI